MSKGSSIILRIYFAVISAVTLFTLMFATMGLLSIGLKTYIFTSADVPSYGLMNCDSPDAKYQYGSVPAPTKVDPAATEILTAEAITARCEASNTTTIENYRHQKANDAVRNLALMLVSLPLFMLHFRFVYRDWKAERNEK